MERDRRKMKGKRVIAGILLAGILAVTLAGCKNTDNTKEETEKSVITLGSDSYPPYNYLNEDGVPTGIDVVLATEAFKSMGYQVDVAQINWEEKKELVESGEIDCIMGCFSMEGRLDDYRWACLLYTSCSRNSCGIGFLVPLYGSYILWRNVGAWRSNATARYCGCSSSRILNRIFRNPYTAFVASSFILLSSVDLWYPHLFKLKKHGKRTAHTGGKQTS